MLSLGAKTKVLTYGALHVFQTPWTIVLLACLAGVQPLLVRLKTLCCPELLLARRVTGEGELLPGRDVNLLVPFKRRA